jgi:hypothetical protein
MSSELESKKTIQIIKDTPITAYMLVANLNQGFLKSFFI